MSRSTISTFTSQGIRSTRVKLERWMGHDENDEPVITSELTDMDALLNKCGLYTV